MTRILILLAAAFALAGCATYDSAYYGRAPIYRDGGYYYPQYDGYGDYYYGRPETIVREYGYGGWPYYGHGYGYYGGGYRYGYDPWGWGGWGWPYHRRHPPRHPPPAQEPHPPMSQPLPPRRGAAPPPSMTRPGQPRTGHREPWGRGERPPGGGPGYDDPDRRPYSRLPVRPEIGTPPRRVDDGSRVAPPQPRQPAPSFEAPRPQPAFREPSRPGGSGERGVVPRRSDGRPREHER